MQGSDPNENKLRKFFNSLKGTWLGRSVILGIVLSAILWIFFGALPDASIGELLASFTISFITGLLLTGFVIRECCMPPREYQPIAEARVGPIDDEEAQQVPVPGVLDGLSVTPKRGPQPNGQSPAPDGDLLRRSGRPRGGRGHGGAEQTEASLRTGNALLDTLTISSKSITAADVSDQVGAVDYLMSPGGQPSSTAQIRGQLNFSLLSPQQQSIEYVKASAVAVGRALVEQLNAKAGNRGVQIDGGYINFLQRVISVEASRTLGIDSTRPYVTEINRVLTAVNNLDETTDYGVLGNSLAANLRDFNEDRLAALLSAARNVAGAVSQLARSRSRPTSQQPSSSNTTLPASGQVEAAAMTPALQAAVRNAQL